MRNATAVLLVLLSIAAIGGIAFAAGAFLLQGRTLDLAMCFDVALFAGAVLALGSAAGATVSQIRAAAPTKEGARCLSN